MSEVIKPPFIVVKLQELTTEDLNACIPEGYTLHQIIHDTVFRVWRVVLMHDPELTVTYRYYDPISGEIVDDEDDDDDGSEPKFNN